MKPSLLPRSSTLIGIAAGLLAVAWLCGVAHRSLERWAGAEDFRVGERERNPYFEAFVQVGKRHNANVEHTRTLKRGRAFELKQSVLFDLEEHSLDVLVVGDSTAVWGVSPPIVSDVSEQKVGVFAYGQARVTSALLKTVQTLAETYLAPDGLLLLSFAPGGWDSSLSARQVSRSLQGITGMASHKLRRFIEQKRSPALFSSVSMDSHWSEVEETVNLLPVVGPVQLPDLALYSTWVEPIVAPRTARAARENADDRDKSFYLWDEWNSILAICPQCRTQPPRAQVPKGKKPTAQMRKVARAVRSLGQRKGFLITYYAGAEKSAELRGLYEKHLKDDVVLVDLEAMWPRDVNVTTLDGAHVANEGALYQSLLLGHWLERYRDHDPNPNRPAEL